MIVSPQTCQNFTSIPDTVDLLTWPWQHEKGNLNLAEAASPQAALLPAASTWTQVGQCATNHMDSTCRSELPCHAPVASALALITDTRVSTSRAGDL